MKPSSWPLNAASTGPQVECEHQICPFDRYDFNDASLTFGAAYWTRLVEKFLAPDVMPA